jgi:hypothetical protein
LAAPGGLSGSHAKAAHHTGTHKIAHGDRLDTQEWCEDKLQEAADKAAALNIPGHRIVQLPQGSIKLRLRNTTVCFVGLVTRTSSHIEVPYVLRCHPFPIVAADL